MVVKRWVAGAEGSMLEAMTERFFLVQVSNST